MQPCLHDHADVSVEPERGPRRTVDSAIVYGVSLGLLALNRYIEPCSSLNTTIFNFHILSDR